VCPYVQFMGNVCDMVTELQKYGIVKIGRCKEWRKYVGTEEHSEESFKIVFTEEVYV
jgi:hypothetical protein